MFPAYKDELLVVVAEVSGRIEAACTVWFEHTTAQTLVGNVDVIMINPQIREQSGRIQSGLLIAIEAYGYVNNCEILNIPADCADE